MRNRMVVGLLAGSAAAVSMCTAAVQAVARPEAENFFWQRTETLHLEVFSPRIPGMPGGSPDLLESALRQVRAVIPVVGPGPRIVIAASRGHAARLNGGSPVAGMYLAQSHTVVLVRSELNPILLRHELTHSETYRLWGKPEVRAAWLVEGLATVIGWCDAASPRTLAARELAEGSLPSLDALLNRFRSVPEIEAYPAAGSITELLISSAAPPTLHRYWRGEPLTLEESEWHAFLQSAPDRSGAPHAECNPVAVGAETGG